MSDWQDQANCDGLSSEVFFPSVELRPRATYWQRLRAAEAEAKQVCLGCVVRTECLEMALAQRIDHGIFGGHNAAERREILARRGR